MKTVKRLALLIAVLVFVLLVAGCASLDFAGHAAYTATAVKDAHGKVTGYEFAIRDGKEFRAREIQFQAVGDTVTMTITEGESKAFRGQALAAKTLTVLPVTGLQELVNGSGIQKLP